jgi:SAM-dependent methyltransferase
VLATVPLRDGLEVVDVGTGYGVMAYELAHLAAVSVTGVDCDAEVLARATALGADLSSWIRAGSSVRFLEGDALRLPLESASADLVTARLLFQHLPDPVAAAREVARVLRPGGAAHVFDVDDGLAISYPEPMPAVAHLEGAYARWQSSRGGDRQVGRKLSSLLASAGLDIAATHVVAQTQHGTSAPGDLERSAAAGRLTAARADMIAAGFISSEEFDDCLRALLAQPSAASFRCEAQVVAVAIKPSS